MEKVCCCTNELCVNRETQLRLARLREELLTNFNTLLVDRIRFLEQTINRLSIVPSSNFIGQHPSPTTITNNRLTPPTSLRRSSSATAYFLQSPSSSDLLDAAAGARSCPSSVDLSNSHEQQKWLLSIKKPLRAQSRTSADIASNMQLSIPKSRPWSSSTNDLVSTSAIGICEKNRLESRRFACDLDDNEIRAFKAMIYMEQARKQHARPLTRLRQALGITSNNSYSSGNFSLYISKKQTNS
jgi:hypothetical protein